MFVGTVDQLYDVVKNNGISVQFRGEKLEGYFECVDITIHELFEQIWGEKYEVADKAGFIAQLLGPDQVEFTDYDGNLSDDDWLSEMVFEADDLTRMLFEHCDGLEEACDQYGTFPQINAMP